MLRIVAGKFKNTLLEVPDSARPMTDRIKSSVFSIIQSRINDSIVLDVFAGSGAIGLEMLSRGCQFVKFIEISTMGVNMIRNNLKKCNINRENYEVVKGDASKVLFKLIHQEDNEKEKYDIIFVTPPHIIVSDEYVRLASNLLKKDGLLIAECPSKRSLSNEIGNIYCERLEKYGNTDIYFYLTKEN